MRSNAHPMPYTLNSRTANRKAEELNRKAQIQAGNGGHWWRYTVFPNVVEVNGAPFTLYTVYRNHSTDGQAWDRADPVMFEPWETGF